MKINKNKLGTIITASALGVAYFIFVRLTGIGIPCLIRLMSGNRIYCPGCGISRMFLSLSESDFSGAFHCNQAIFLMLPLWSVCIVLWLFDKGGKFLKIAGIISVAILVIFGIWRNFN